MSYFFIILSIILIKLEMILLCKKVGMTYNGMEGVFTLLMEKDTIRKHS